MKRYLATLSLSILSACANVKLGYVYPAVAPNRDADIAQCVEQARVRTEAGQDQVAMFAAGASIVGYAPAVQQARATQRQFFAECMTAKGYTVREAT